MRLSFTHAEEPPEVAGAPEALRSEHGTGKETKEGVMVVRLGNVLRRPNHCSANKGKESAAGLESNTGGIHNVSLKKRKKKN